MTIEKRNELALSLLSKVRAIAICHHYTVFEPFEDVMQEGFIGALSAVEHYDAKQASLKYFAGLRIRGAIQDYLRQVDPLGRGDRQQVSRGLREDVETIPLTDAMMLPGADNPEAKAMDEWERTKLSELLATLPLRWQGILGMFLQGASLASIARHYGVNSARIGQIRQAALNRMRKALEDQQAQRRMSAS